MKLTLAAVLLTLCAAPVLAEDMADATKMTCAELMAQDMDGMMKSGMMMKEAMKDDAKMAAMTDEEMTKMAEQACKMHPDAMVMDALKM